MNFQVFFIKSFFLNSIHEINEFRIFIYIFQ